MLGIFGRPLALCSYVVIGLFVLATVPVLADSQTGNSVTITAVVAPVRYVLVDDHDSIKQITSNTPLNVVPKAYKNSYQSAPLPLSTAVDSQYVAIMAHVNTKNDGVIYVRPAAKQPAIISDWLKKLL